MGSYLSRAMNERNKALRSRSRYKKLYIITAVVVLTVTIAALILPAITSSTATFCGYKEHQHSVECYEKLLVCEAVTDGEEADTHVHTDECYEASLVCTKEEHTHSLACMSDPTADVEEVDAIKSTVGRVPLTGDAAEDILQIAKTQLGYYESIVNYAVASDGVTKNGYTRYGQWYGDPYMEWNHAFVSFCAHFANVEVIPDHNSCESWITMLRDSADALYVSARDYTPYGGDIVLIDTGGDGEADRVAVVSYVDSSKGKLVVIEGDAGDQVKNVVYDMTDDKLIGYIALATPEVGEHHTLDNISGTVLYLSSEQLAYQYSSYKLGGADILGSLLIPYSDHVNGNWTPSTLKWTARAKANYVVAYSTDSSVGAGQYTAKGIYESSYSGEGQKLTALIRKAYPYVSAEEMSASLRAAYESGEISLDLSCCSESEFIAASQWAIREVTGATSDSAVSSPEFPGGNAGALYPLSNVGHGEDSSHVKMIKDWLVTRVAPERITVDSTEVSVERQGDGSYNATVKITLNRALVAGESIRAHKVIGDEITADTSAGEGTRELTVKLEGLSEVQLDEFYVRLTVTEENTQAFAFEGAEGSLIGGLWGELSYELEARPTVERVSLQVRLTNAEGFEGVDSIPVQLYADGKKYGEPIALSPSNNWSFRWSSLVKYSSQGDLIKYTVSDVHVPGYLTETKNENAQGADISYVVSGTKAEKIISVKIKAQWTGKSDGKYPAALSVQLLRNGEAYGESVTLSADNSFSYKWDGLTRQLGLDIFDYTVGEVSINGYSTEIKTEESENGDLLITVVNKWAPEYHPIRLAKADKYDSSQLLPGAVFDLFVASDDEDAVLIPGTVGEKGVRLKTIIIGEEGTFDIDELLLGEVYYLIELCPPSGYSMLEGPVALHPYKNEEGNKDIIIKSGDEWSFLSVDSDGTTRLTVNGRSSYVLPETGGHGTVLLSITGLLLVVIAALNIIKNYFTKNNWRKTK